MTRSIRLLPLVAASCALLIAVAQSPAVAADGPRMVKNLAHGSAGLDGGGLAVIGVLGSKLLFSADIGATVPIGVEVYRTDGTRRGTGLLKDINAGPGGSEASSPYAMLHGIGYFTATSATHGHELWRTNGTPGGTRMVVDLSPDNNEYAYLWGTFKHQVVIQQSDAGGPGDHGEELWRSDGTAAGTKRMTDVQAGPTDSLFAGVIALGDLLLFISNDGTSGLELFRSNGTPAGTSLVKDINEEPGGILSYPGGGVTPARFKGSIWFFAIDGISGDPGDHGGELWHSDGTPGGTKLLKDITPGVGSTTIRWLQPLGKHLVFLADAPGIGEEPWVTDGTRAGTRRLKDLYPGIQGSQASPLGIVDGVLYLVADGGPGVGRELYRTDGTPGGTRLVKDIRPGAGSSDPDYGAVLGGRLYFAATNGRGRELWVTNGTAAGTKRVADINPGPASADVQAITTVGKRLIFFATDGIHGVEPWTYAP